MRETDIMSTNEMQTNDGNLLILSMIRLRVLVFIDFINEMHAKDLCLVILCMRCLRVFFFFLNFIDDVYETTAFVDFIDEIYFTDEIYAIDGYLLFLSIRYILKSLMVCSDVS